jgi:hypothetical protein
VFSVVARRAGKKKERQSRNTSLPHRLLGLLGLLMLLIARLLGLFAGKEQQFIHQLLALLQARHMNQSH